ncbi:Wadjet anti-phage system protein JetD domain-containing protein [Thioalkalivibrio sp. HK1]|uniref:Wadjet anti-phage system protein JetD domain-containing protein n=1 Tax=Thioalkalivibrio sp. HK1 TaxID=1469245 RepID=UPI0004ACC742|nr:Wadjet anti-phage system protein JetD domain-containing protein [Thioalkalivibrio sp. HK1]
MIWENEDARLALLELVSRGTLKRRHSQREIYDTLAALPWTRLTGRRKEIALVEERRESLVELIDRVWPEWQSVLADLNTAGLPPTPEGHSRLRDMKRATDIPEELPERINRRTAASLVATHSKASLTESRRQALGETAPTQDGSIRLRPPSDLSARTPKGTIDLAQVAAILGEVSIPERALLDDLTFQGSIRAVLLIENLGAWRDLPPPPGWLLAYVPGWDTATVARLLDRIEKSIENTPVIHFGDIDPNGVRIMLHLQKRIPDLRWFLPEFWFDLTDTTAQRTVWPQDLDLTFAPTRVRRLASQGLWLEQERIVLDPRTPDALEEMLMAEPFNETI